MRASRNAFSLHRLLNNAIFIERDGEFDVLDTSLRDPYGFSKEPRGPVPSDDGVRAGAEAGKHKMTGCVSFRTPPVWRHNNRRGHIRVQTAVDKDDTGLRKRHCARL